MVACIDRKETFFRYCRVPKFPLKTVYFRSKPAEFFHSLPTKFHVAPALEQKWIYWSIARIQQKQEDLGLAAEEPDVGRGQTPARRYLLLHCYTCK